MTTGREALLITGRYGAGKSSLVAELAERLELADMSFGAIDVDWLSWFHVKPGVAAPRDVRSANLAYVADRYLASGATRLLLAQAARDDEDVRVLRAQIPCRLRVVRLDVPIATIEQRLAADPTLGRAHDLEVAREWARQGHGEVTADLVLDGELPLSVNARRLLDWLNWLPEPSTGA